MLKAFLVATSAAAALSIGMTSAPRAADFDDADTVVINERTVIERDSAIVDDDDDTGAVVVDDDDDDDAGPVERGVRVYGWSRDRPPDCGTFRYWDGDDCVDARVDPTGD